jgi:hypothetical protein
MGDCDVNVLGRIRAHAAAPFLLAVFTAFSQLQIFVPNARPSLATAARLRPAYAH